ncbi:MAG: hypothetical protein K0U47_12495 [Epsilonproteobacteria bacterium]|nr:hypothetical protein [Campylobacterota bacterium]
MKKVIVMSVALGLVTWLVAKTPTHTEDNLKQKIAKMAGEKGRFATHEMFPKDYFLISKNLPFVMGLVLNHPQSSTLELSDDQKKTLKAIKEKTVPIVLKEAKAIKTLELALADKIVKGAKAADLSAEVEKIGALKIALTKKHLVCIEKSLAILTPKQLDKMMQYAGKKGKNKHKQESAHPIEELVDLPHPIKMIMPNREKLKITVDQEKALEEKMMAVFPEKIHGNMDKAEVIETKIKKAVLSESKTKEDLKVDIQTLADIKVSITNDHIDALNTLETILTKAQFSQLLIMMGHKKEHSHDHGSKDHHHDHKGHKH